MTLAIIIAGCLLMVIGLVVTVSGIVMCLRSKPSKPDWLKHEDDMHGDGQ